MFNFIRTTIIGGIIFLIPVVIIVAILGKAFKIMMQIAVPLGKLIPIESVGGIALVNILAVFAILLFSFLAGMIAKSKLGQKAFDAIDTKLLIFIPGYTYIKSMTASALDEEQVDNPLKPILAKLDDQSQLAFEVERTENGLVVVYLPSAPDPKSGNVVYLTEDRVEPLDVGFGTISGSLKRLGKGSGSLISPN